MPTSYWHRTRLAGRSASVADRPADNGTRVALLVRVGNQLRQLRADVDALLSQGGAAEAPLVEVRRHLIEIERELGGCR